VVVHPVLRSYKSLFDLMMRIHKEAPLLRGLGVQLVHETPDAANNVVQLTVTELNDGVVSRLQERYEASAIAVAQEDMPEPSVPLVASRLADIPPWNGGDRLTYAGSACSSGIPVQANTSSNTYMLTAGHCFPVGAGVFNGSNFVGNVTYQDWNASLDPRSDSELISTPMSKYIWRGPLASSYRGTQISGAYDTLGEYGICASGSFTGEDNCGDKIVGVNVCGEEGGQGVCPSDVVQHDGALVAQHGDSGGPVYSPQSGGLGARGMIQIGYGGYRYGVGFSKVGFVNIQYLCVVVWDCHVRT